MLHDQATAHWGGLEEEEEAIEHHARAGVRWLASVRHSGHRETRRAPKTSNKSVNMESSNKYRPLAQSV